MNFSRIYHFFKIFPTGKLTWINFESTIRENSKSVKINSQKKKKKKKQLEN